MKVKVELGVAKAKDLLGDRNCYRVGGQVTRLIDALIFSEFYFSKPRPGSRGFLPSELSHISTGIYSSRGIAERMLNNGSLPTGLQEKTKKFMKAANSLNNKVKTFVNPTTEAPLKEFKSEDRQIIEQGLKSLHRQANELNTEAEKLCFVEKKGFPSRTITKKTAMAGAPHARTMMGSAAVSAPAPIAPGTSTETLRKFVYPSFSRPAFHKSRRKS